MKDLLLSLLQNPFVLATLSGLVAFIFMFLDTKITQSFRNNSTYYKNAGLVSSLVGLSIYLSKNGLGNFIKPNNQNNQQLDNTNVNNVNNVNNTKGMKVNEEFYELESDDDFDT